jgi:carboxypeptidase Q
MRRIVVWGGIVLALSVGIRATAPDVAIDRIATAMLGDTPFEDDLRVLSDRIGGRPTGSEANARAVTWAEATLRKAGVAVRREPFTMPVRWLERSASAEIHGSDVSFSPRVAAMPFSRSTPAAGITAPILDGGRGSADDFARLGSTVSGAFLLVEQELLADVDGLFKEYSDSAAIEQRAFASGAAGVVYMASRASGLLYRHNVSIGPANTRPMAIMERDSAWRVMRLLRTGERLTISLHLDIDNAGSYTAENVIADIPGGARGAEIVLIGAHLDSWDLGSGTLDNGANVALLIDLARQIKRLELQPARTIRVALWNGEEQAMLGSWGYVRAHRDELDRHVIAASIDIGCGHITGWFTGGRPDVKALVDRHVMPMAGLGPFTQIDAPIVGTDNFDFMLEGIPNLVANQEAASYGPNYHAASDQFAQCNIREQRTNGAIVAALVWALAQDTTRLPRHDRAAIQTLIDSTDLGAQMKTFALYDDWVNGTRGRRASQ